MDSYEKSLFWLAVVLTAAWITFVVGREVLEVWALWKIGSR